MIEVMLDVKTIKKDFPIFKTHPHLVYLDSTATSLKPKAVIDKIVEYYEKYSANVFRGIYKLSEKATAEFEATRKKVASFINAKSEEEIVFTRSTTESINLLAYSLGREIVASGDEVVVSVMEHHSNFVPWQMLSFEVGADFKVLDIDRQGRLLLDKKNIRKIVTKKTKVFALTYVSNVLGTVNPLFEIIRMVKEANSDVVVVIDAAQAVPHLSVDVQKLGGDFLAFSGHKMLGPTGVGVLWGRKTLLEKMFPFNFGGEMIIEVHLDKTVFKEPPHKFEAGTPHIAGVIGFSAAIDYLAKLKMEKIKKHEEELLEYALSVIKEEFGDRIEILGPKGKDRAGILSFSLEDFHPHDVAQLLDEEQIAVRAGHHCAMPLHKRLRKSASVRASFYVYNDKSDVDRLVEGLKKVRRILG